MAGPPPVLVLIGVDPRHSGRANEAMRIGLGITAGDNPVILVLTGGGVHLLDADTDLLEDGDDVAKFRATLKDLGIPFHVDVAARPAAADWNADGHPVVSVDGAAIADLMRRSRRVLVFA